jgi:hypothetical protein
VSTVSRARLPWGILAFLSPAVLAPSLLMEWGYRDDYSVLREAAQEPAKLIAICIAEGRPVYGVLLRASFALLDGIPELWAVRLLGAVLVGCVGLLLCRILVSRGGWAMPAAALCASLATLLPSAQIVSSWAICWPQALAAVLALGAFAVADRAMPEVDDTNRVLARRLAAAVLLVAAALTYQSNALMYIVPVAAIWLRGSRDWRWLLAHGALLVASLAIALGLTVSLFALFGFKPAARMVVETHALSKLAWFVQQPLRESLALYVLRDAAGGTAPWYGVMQAFTGLASLTALVAAARTRAGLARVLAWGGMLLAAYAVSLIARERWPTYRTLWPMTAIVLTATWCGIERWFDALRAHGSARLAAAALVVIGAATSAAWNVRQLIAVPQAAEWVRMQEIGAAYDPHSGDGLYLVLPRPTEAIAPIRHLDEFGALSADADWVAKEMFKQALRVVHPTAPDMSRLVWQTSYRPPPRMLLSEVFVFRSKR